MSKQYVLQEYNYGNWLIEKLENKDCNSTLWERINDGTFLTVWNMTNEQSDNEQTGYRALADEYIRVRSQYKTNSENVVLVAKTGFRPCSYSECERLLNFNRFAGSPNVSRLADFVFTYHIPRPSLWTVRGWSSSNQTLIVFTVLSQYHEESVDYLVCKCIHGFRKSPNFLERYEFVFSKNFLVPYLAPLCHISHLAELEPTDTNSSMKLRKIFLEYFAIISKKQSFTCS